MNEHEPYSPWPLAWHPEAAGDQLDPARFTVPECGSDRDEYQRTGGGLWTSPMITRHYTAWSIQHDIDDMSGHQVREGWAVGWPDRARTALVESHADLIGLASRFPCRRHRSLHNLLIAGARTSFEDLDPDLWARPLHDDMLFPPLDLPAMAHVYDALHVTSSGIKDTFQKVPGTTAWQVETVLWLRPVWQVLYPIATLRFDASTFVEAFACPCTLGTSPVCTLT